MKLNNSIMKCNYICIADCMAKRWCEIIIILFIFYFFYVKLTVTTAKSPHVEVNTQYVNANTNQIGTK